MKSYRITEREDPDIKKQRVALNEWIVLIFSRYQILSQRSSSVKERLEKDYERVEENKSYHEQRAVSSFYCNFDE